MLSLHEKERYPMWSQKEAVTGPPLALTENLLIGVGGHKKVYVHPYDETLCVKVLHYGERDEDWQKELRYRRSRARRGLSSTLLTRYYGACPLEGGGIGHIFERVRDFDGQDSLSFQQHIDLNRSSPHIDFNAAITGMVTFRYLLFREKIITSNMEPSNFCVQIVAPDFYRLRIMDNIGSPVLIPLLFYIDALALRHIKRYWRRFVLDLNRQYPWLINENIAAILL